MTLKGIDVSKYQETTPSLTGLSFLFARATLATDPDVMYKRHIAAARRAGLITGAYHFNWSRLPIDVQVKAFLAAAGDVHLLALDVETQTKKRLPNGEIRPRVRRFNRAEARAFIEGVKAADPLHRKVGLYMSDSGFYRRVGQDFNWIAKWSRVEPIKDWSFWQRTSHGMIDGFHHRLDLDVFNGTKAELDALAQESQMTEYKAKGEDWKTAKAPVRLTPDRSAPAAVTLPAGSIVRTVAEFTQDGEAWRVTRLPDGRTGFLIRGDLTPLVPGGDPAVDAPFLAYVQRQPVA
jgi:GH25 family lysozyme M1 (1,4-beta-N-acetylmuramidase)